MSMERPLRRSGVGKEVAWPERTSQQIDARGESCDPWNAAVGQGKPLDLAEFPSALLLRVANVIHQASTAVYAKGHGLSLPEWRVLGRLCESAPMRLTTLCQVSQLDKSQATRILRGLSARRLVRTSADADHKHRRIVDITARGREIALAVFPEAAAEQLKLLGALTAEERRVTFNVLRKLLALYGAEIPAPAAAYKVLHAL
jgi:DNA-binding MarR family transcriptional regulator